MPESYLLGLIGSPVGHSLSGHLHEAALRASGLKGSYKLLEVAEAELAGTITRLSQDGYRGVNVTIPYKQVVLPLLDELCPLSDLLGAVNTIVFESNGEIRGFNTDVYGFEKALAELLPERCSKVAAMVLGAGGAARASLVGLFDLGFEKVFLTARKKSAALRLIEDLESRAQVAPGAIVATGLEQLNEKQFSVLINATPIGQTDRQLPLWLSDSIAGLASDCLIYDLVYSRSLDQPTPVVAAGRKRDLASFDGIDMLVYQAARAFEIWTGQIPDPVVMKASLFQAGDI
ncbi:MAG: shikimate dehydrogenase [Candidatus Obscuribacterales bacterium]|nr:shikimate dehydrogenase [Candidatus Obscuribacterales bacterium]